GHPEIELALVELYRETGEARYLNLATFFIDQRGSGRMRGYGAFGAEYHQDRVPVRQATVVEGHAVRQLYLTAGVTDLYLETGEAALMAAMERLWRDLTAHKMHVTAGFGARFTGEAFGEAYELPADRCYCETCASIAAMMWNWRMLLATGEPRYADLLERSLYNGFLSGVSLDGRHYFYVNPLQSRGGIERPEWYGCACCPPNVMRQIALVVHYAATCDAGGVQIHQYMPTTIRTDGASGPQLAVRVETDYPWSGRVRAVVEETGGPAWTLALRIPAWCGAATLKVNGAEAQSAAGGQYATIQRTWRAGDVVELDIPMAPVFIEPNPRVDAIRDSLCIQRGPVLYCLEQVDQPELDLLDVRVASDALMSAEWRDDLLDGVVTVQLPAYGLEMGDWEDQLYLPADKRPQPAHRVLLTAVPYYAWANREPGAMRMWIPVFRGSPP
ncbi:MAG: glycoside hydrolase family 127 protein, partial [Anaerolineales bacterium]|nr:glycoside hydrolase family 127 protein [Anaerolineales bacterium]